MMGHDTNVLLRWIINDPTAPEQVELVHNRLGSDPGPFFVNNAVLAETVWILRTRARFTRQALADIVDALLNAPNLRLQEAKAVANAVVTFAKGPGGFADHLIGEINRHAGCKATLTFDKAASKSPLFRSLAGE